MQKDLLRALLGVKGLTVEQLREKDPALADAVLALVRSAETAQLNQALDWMPDHLRVKIGEIDFTRATGDVVEHLWMKLLELEIDRELAKQVVHHAEKVKLGRGLDPQQPIGTERAVAQQIATAKVHEVSAVAGLSEAAADAVALAVAAPSALDEATLTRLVSERKLTDSQARDVGFSAALYQLADEDTALASAIRSASFPQLGGKSPASTADLAKLRPADWTSFFTSRKTAPAANGGSEELGATFAARFAALHPGVAISARLPPVNAGDVTGALQELGPLFTQNPKVIGGRFGQSARRESGARLRPLRGEPGSGKARTWRARRDSRRAAHGPFDAPGLPAHLGGGAECRRHAPARRQRVHVGDVDWHPAVCRVPGASGLRHRQGQEPLGQRADLDGQRHDDRDRGARSVVRIVRPARRRQSGAFCQEVPEDAARLPGPVRERLVLRLR